MTTKLALWCDRVVEGGWLMLLVTTPAFFNIYSSRVFEPDKMTVFRCIVAVMCAAWAIRTIERNRTGTEYVSRLRQTINSSAVAIAVFAFGIVSVLTTITSVDPALSFWGSYQRLQGSLNLLGYALVFFMALTTIRARAQVERIITVVLITSAFVSLYGVMQRLRLDPLPWGGDVTDRITSSLGNAIFLGAYLLMAMPLALVRLIDAIVPLWKTSAVRDDVAPVSITRQSLLIAMYTALFGIQSIALVWTKSRGPWEGAAVGLGLLFIVLLLRYRRYLLAGGLVAASLAAIVFVVLLNIPGTPIAPLRNVSPYLDRLGTVMDFEEGTNKVRLLIWAGDGVGSGAIGLIISSPLRLLVGHGPETMYIAYNPFYPPDLAHLEARNASPDRSHNDPLDFLVTMGVLGLAAYLAVLGTSLVSGLRTIWRAEDLWLQLTAAGFIGGIVGHFFEALVGITIAATRTHFFVYAAAIATLPALLRLAQAAATELRRETAPVTVEAPVAAARTGGGIAVAERPSGSSRRKNNRKAASRAKAEAARVAQSERRGVFFGRYYAIGYLAMTVVLVAMLFLSTARSSDLARWVTENPKTALLIMIVWVFFGIFCLAAWASRSERGMLAMRRHLLPVYVPIGAAALVLSGGVFLPNVEADIYYKLGFGFDGAQRWDQSVKSYFNAVDLQPNQDYYFLFLGRSYLELARRAQDRPDLPLPQNLSDIRKLGLDLPRLDRNSRDQLFNAALVVLSRARDLSPLNTDHWANLGRLYRFWGDATQDPALKQQRYEQALAYQDHAVGLSPHLAHLETERALTLAALGRFDDATAAFTRAATLDARYPNTFLSWGDVLLQQQRLDEAAEQYRKAIAIDRGIVQAHSALGYIYSRQGKLVESLQENLVAAELAPQDFTIRRNLAFLYADLNQPDQALQQAQQALQLAPQDQKPQLEQVIQQLRQRVQGRQ